MKRSCVRCRTITTKNPQPARKMAARVVPRRSYYTTACHASPALHPGPPADIPRRPLAISDRRPDRLAYFAHPNGKVLRATRPATSATACCCRCTPQAGSGPTCGLQSVNHTAIFRVLGFPQASKVLQLGGSRLTPPNSRGAAGLFPRGGLMPEPTFSPNECVSLAYYGQDVERHHQRCPHPPNQRRTTPACSCAPSVRTAARPGAGARVLRAMKARRRVVGTRTTIHLRSGLPKRGLMEHTVEVYRFTGAVPSTATPLSRSGVVNWYPAGRVDLGLVPPGFGRRSTEGR